MKHIKGQLCYSGWELAGIMFRCYRLKGHKGHHSTIKAFTWWD